ncbi:MAG TPA: TMEM175 family protein [Pyrinomonadaceae bacterium]|nr:TMEM175 family protein [Pyrinomonadaceae bacterium]
MDKHEPDALLSFERVVFFSDAVFAIVITLLVLELKVPHLTEHTESSLRHALVELLPRVAGFVISFLIIGLMWIEHHRIFRYIADYDGGLLWRNLLLLLCVSFVPFPTALFSENFWSRTAFILYTASFGGVATAKLLIWRHAAKANLLKKEVTPALERRIARRSLAVPLACALAIVLSFVSIFLAPVSFAFIPLLARVLDPTSKKGKPEAATANEEAAA